MKIIVTNILAVILGLVIGSSINMGIIMISSSIIPPPNGADVTTMEGLKASIHLFQPKHFVFPFLAHAFGTFVGALITAIVASSYKFKLSLLIGVFFLIGGVINTFILPAPSWFITFDLLVAYIPMAWLGWKIIYLNRKQNK
ncbi:MAG: hypothetical protein HKP59_03245 [Lutibacter sp.]|uniref:hypothetical protein n=1 Tax=Lutibacter sp. TaxID=1925666 RepID=UPI0017F3C900|nr:hypothetical protein [Lutibacter sp.]MBT8316619.1 hypothetical protein [Lutibacter sp.]NNJ57479.1 hypothetical protein [Lutibacter sp.]